MCRRPNGYILSSATKLENHIPLYWLLRGDRVIASSRLQGYLIHEEIQRSHRRFHSELMLAPPIWLWESPWDESTCKRFVDATGNGVVVMQKMFGEELRAVPQMIRDAGGVTVFVHSDLDEDNAVPFECNMVIVPSRVLAEWYKQRGCKNVRVIQDPNEDTWAAPLEVRPQVTNLTIGWIGHENNWGTLEVLRQVLAERDFQDFRLVTVSNHESADIVWSPENMLAALPSFDLSVIPFGTSPELQYKSANRATLIMGAGIPVVTGRLPAYEDVIRHGSNGFLFETAEELRHCLSQLRDPNRRREIGSTAHDDISRTFTVKAAAEKWVEAIDSLLPLRNTDKTVAASETQTRVRQFQFEQWMQMSEFAQRLQREEAAIEYAKSALKIGLKHPGNGRITRPLKTLAALKGIYSFSAQKCAW